MIDLMKYHGIVVNTSGGKDSQTSLRVIATEAERLGILERVVVVHADLGHVEWPDAKELAIEQASHYGLEVIVVEREFRGKPENLLELVERREKWPSSSVRFCTSYMKREPCGPVITATADWARDQFRVKRPRILNVFGFRAEESPARAKRKPFAEDARLTSSRRYVDTWLPIHEWVEDRVWGDIRESEVRHHYAYDLGMPRLSCRFCIFAPRSALLIAGQHNPELLREYVELEERIGHDFKKGMKIKEIEDALAAGEKVDVSDLTGAWNM